MNRKLAFSFLSLFTFGVRFAYGQENILPNLNCFDIRSGVIANANPVWFNYKGSSNDKRHLIMLSALQGLDADLSTANKELLLVYPPRPSMFLPDELAQAHDVNRSKMRADFAAQLGYLTSAGLRVWDTDLFVTRFNDVVPLQRAIDHHWSSSGAVAAAYDISVMLNNETASVDEFIEALSSLDRELLPPRHPSAWKSAANGTCDLTGYGYRDYDYDFPPTEVSGTSLEDMLFGESTERSVVFGTSFSDIERQLFVRALQYFMGADVVGMAVNGGGTVTSIALGIRDVVEDSTYKNVIWEIEDIFSTASILGAATLARGILDGSCQREDPLYREFYVSSQIDADWDLGIQFELTYANGVNEEIVEIGSATLRGVSANNAPSDAWQFRVPDVFNDEGNLMSLLKVRTRLFPYEHGNADASGPISYTVTGCMKLDAERVQLSAL